jgi:hypothetical protein
MDLIEVNPAFNAKICPLLLPMQPASLEDMQRIKGIS